MFFIYSDDLFLLNKQVKKIIEKNQIPDQETEVITYSWIEDEDQKIFDDILTTSFFVDQKIIVVKDAYFLTEKKKDASWIDNDSKKITQLLKIKNIPNIVIFTLNESKISKKLKLTKEFENQVKMVEVKELSHEQMISFVSKKIELKEKKIALKTVEYFLEKLPSDMQIINNELQKLLNLNQQVIDKEAIDNNVSHYYTSDAYKLSEYFQTNQVEKFIIEFQNYLESANDLVRLIYLLNTNITFVRDCLILQKNGRTEQKIAELLNAHPYRVKMALNKNNLNISELNDKILVLYKLNKQVVSGLVDPVTNAELELIKNMSRS